MGTVITIKDTTYAYEKGKFKTVYEVEIYNNYKARVMKITAVGAWSLEKIHRVAWNCFDRAITSNIPHPEALPA